MRKIFIELGLSTCVSFLSYGVILSVQQSDWVSVAMYVGIIFFGLLGGIDVASDPNGE